MTPQCGTERGGRRGSPATVTVLRSALEAMASGEYVVVPAEELRRRLSQAERNLGRMRLRGGRYRALQFSPHIAALYQRLRVHRKAG